MPHRHAYRSLQKHSAFTALLLAVLLSSSLTVYLNQRRVDEIDKQRVTSCQRTYEGVRDVFRPFFRTKRIRTPREQRNVDKFNRTVNQLKARCGQQTGVKEER